MPDLTIPNNETVNDSILLNFAASELEETLYQSDEYDYTPNDLTIVFEQSRLKQAKIIFQQNPDLFSLKFRADISSDSFEGKLRTDFIHFYCQGDVIYACFCNDWTGTRYEVDISQKTADYLANKAIS